MIIVIEISTHAAVKVTVISSLSQYHYYYWCCYCCCCYYSCCCCYHSYSYSYHHYYYHNCSCCCYYCYFSSSRRNSSNSRSNSKSCRLDLVSLFLRTSKDQHHTPFYIISSLWTYTVYSFLQLSVCALGRTLCTLRVWLNAG